MTATVRIPVPLQKLTNNQALVAGSGASVGAVIDSLEAAYPGLKANLLEDSGKIRGFVNIFVNGENAKASGGTAAPVQDGDEVTIIPAIAGG